MVVTPPAGHTLTGDPDAYSTNPSKPYPPCDSTDLDYEACDNQYGVSLLNGQENRTADFGYLPPGVIGDTLWIDTDGDNPRDAGEPGIANITVWLCTSTPCNSGNALETTTTDLDGNYSFGDLADDTYYVAVDASDPDFPPALTQTYDADGGTPDNVTSSIVISGGVVTSIGGVGCTNCSLDSDFGYRFAGNNSVSGTAFADDGSGGGTTNDGTQQAGETTTYPNVPVYLYYCGADNDCDTTADNVLVGSKNTDSNGDYSFTNLADGVYRVVVNSTAPALGGANPTPTGSPVTYKDVDLESLSATTTPDDEIDLDFGFLSSLDLGDLPANYNNTELADNGARHLVGTVYLGTAVDSDSDGQESATATGTMPMVGTMRPVWSAPGSGSMERSGATIDVTVCLPDRHLLPERMVGLDRGWGFQLTGTKRSSWIRL